VKVFGIKPDGIINFLLIEPPFQYNPTLKIPHRANSPRLPAQAGPAQVHYMRFFHLAKFSLAVASDGRENHRPLDFPSHLFIINSYKIQLGGKE
jgi:hypothetical protein